MNNIAYYRNLVLLAGLGPLLMLGWDAWHDQLGANGVNNALHITGILSLVFLFASLLITPLRVLTGLNSLIAYRRTLGLYGFAYAALHFVLYVVFDRMGSFSSTFDEIASRRFLMVGFVALALMLPLAVTSTNTMIRILGPARWKLLHRLAYVATLLGVMHYYMLVKSDVRQPIAFAAVLASIFGFRVVKHYLDLRRDAAQIKLREPVQPRDAPMFWNGDLTVENIHRETHDVKTFRLVHPGGDIPFRHRPGQYLTLTLSVNGQSVKRSYTIASSPTQRGHVELTIKRHSEGLVSRALHDQVKVGDCIRVSAPSGRFFFDDLNSKAVVLIAGGVGVTPMISILRNLTDRAWSGTIYFIYAVRTRDDRIFEAELVSLSNRFANVHVITYFSATDQAFEGPAQRSQWQENSGYFSAAMLDARIPDLRELPIFLCGPEPMMQSVRSAMVALGIPNEHIATEAFASPKGSAVSNESSIDNPIVATDGAPHSVAITFEKSSQILNVESSTTILEAAEQAGVTLTWECRSGVCGQCKVRCRVGRVRMESREALTKSEEAKGFILACQSRPITKSVSIDA